MIEKDLKRKLGIISGILFLGLVAYALIFLLMNKNLNYTEIAGNMELVNWRHSWRSRAEGIIAVCGSIYIIGHIIVLYPYIKDPNFPVRKMIIYLILQIACMFVCVLPFAVFDMGFFGDYVFPIWSLTFSIALILVGFFVIRCYKNYRH